MIKITAAAALVVFCAGCGAHWQTLEVEDVSYRDLYDLTLHVIDDEGFKPRASDINLGTISTNWNYEKVNDQARFPIRRRVEAEIDGAGDGAYVVRIRIDQEANWEGYRIIDPEISDKWDEYGYDDETADLMLKKIEIQVREYGPSEEFYERFRQAEELRAKVPEVLDPRRR